MQSLTAIFGVAALFGLALTLSNNRSAINYRVIGIAFALQVAVAGLILYVPAGKQLLSGLVTAVQSILDFAGEGIAFVFGENTSKTLGFTVAFQVLPVIVFFSALMSTLYYLRIMPLVVSVIGGALHRVIGTSRTESLTAASNIFVGHTEAPLVVRPYLATMTRSELFAVMTGGCATIAGTVMAGYAALGIDLNFLLTASFMAAPGGLLMAKIIYPETETPREFDPRELSQEDSPVNIFDAIGAGATLGLKVALNVGALLLAFVAMIALLNGLISGLGGWFGYPELTLQSILGVILAPLAFLLGIPWEEAATAGSLIGQKLIVNEFYAYVNFIEVKESLSPQTQAIVTFALCGFANLAAIAMLLGALGNIIPERRQDVARLGLRSVLAGSLANLMSAALAGLFLSIA